MEFMKIVLVFLSCFSTLIFALPAPLEDAIRFVEANEQVFHLSRKRIVRDADGMYLLEFSQPTCTFDDKDKKTADSECRDELQIDKSESDNTNSGGKGVEFELLTEEKPEEVPATEAPEEESGWFKKAWKTIKKKVNEFIEAMKNLWNQLKAKVVKVFDSDVPTSVDSANKYMKLEQCVAKKMSLSDADGYPDKAAMVKLVNKIVKPSGKELSSENSKRLASCIDAAIQSAKDSNAADSTYECLKDGACHAHYKAANCIKVALMEHCMSVGTNGAGNDVGNETDKEVATNGKNSKNPAKYQAS